MKAVNKLGSLFAIFAFLAVALLLMGTAAYAQAMPTLPPCYNGVQDEGEPGVDCGGSCAYGQHFELCDGKDNDRDCLVDEGIVCGPSSINNATNGGPLAQQTESINTVETVQESAEEYHPVKDRNPGKFVAEGPPKIVSDEEGYIEPRKPSETVDAPSQTEAVALPTEEPPETLPEKKSLLNEALEEGGAYLRKLASDFNVYLPESDKEPDEKLHQRFKDFAQKHQAELTGKFRERPQDEEEMASVLKQFSEETYTGKKEEKQGIIARVARFFARLFS